MLSCSLNLLSMKHYLNISISCTIISYRVYPEPWQVVLQKVVENKIENTVAWTSKERPDYNTAVAKLLAAAK